MLDTRKVFVSYNWSTPEYEQFVEELATDLRNNGVGAILDKWRLKPGQNKYHLDDPESPMRLKAGGRSRSAKDQA